MLVNGLFQSWRSIRENATEAFSGIIMICISFVILGSIILVYINLIHLTSNLFQKANYSIFADSSIDETGQRFIVERLKEIDGVKNITIIPKDVAQQDLISSFGEAGQVLENIELPHLPLIIEFSLNRITHTSRDQLNAINNLPGVSDIVSGKEARDQVEVFFTISEFVGLFLILLVFVSVVLMIYSAIQIAVRTRIEEIEILKTLGATTWYIKSPFVVEGVLISLLGYGLSLGIIYTLFQFVLAGITFNDATYGIRDYAMFFTLPQILITLGIILILGGISSSKATKKVLRELNA